MTKYTMQGFPPTPEELARWGREAGYFRYQPPNPNAPRGTVAATGWGVHKAHMPHGDAVAHVLAMFKRDVAGVPVREKLRPEYKWSILSVCMAHFLWFRGKVGAPWIMRFFGVAEVPPFLDGYAYLYVTKETNSNSNKHYVRLEKDGSINLRIFRRTERVLDPPVTEPYDEVVEQMQEILRKARDPNAAEPIAEAAPDMYFWVSEQIRDWFLEVNPNKHWPSEKASRIGGYQWAKTLERQKGVLFYDAIDKVELFKSRAYRLKDDRGGVLWCGGKDIRAVPLVDYLREYECNRYSDHQLDKAFRCSSCNKMRTCLPMSGDQKMCAHCFGSIVEKDNRPSLDWCTMKECRQNGRTGCPDFLSSQSDLINLKNRLNREVHFPVQR